MDNTLPPAIRNLSTPAVIVDLDIAERNLEEMADYCTAHGLALRPHTKTHKSLAIAGKQLSLGAIGLTVAKVGEAEVMAAAGASGILVAHPVLGNEKLRRLAALPRCIDLLVSLDSIVAAQALSRIAQESGRSFGVLVEFDSGYHRCGVAPDHSCAELGLAVQALEGLRLLGLMTYFGSVWGDRQTRETELEHTASAVQAARRAFSSAGLPLEIVSAGSTPAARISHKVPGITEIRPGTYVYNDMNTVHQGLCSIDDCAVRVVTTVISTAVSGQVIIDAGSKVFSSDGLGSGSKRGFGRVLEVEGAIVSRLNEEHGYLEAPDLAAFQIGQVLTVIPNHVCTCINMHDQVIAHRSGHIIGQIKIDARGKVC